MSTDLATRVQEQEIELDFLRYFYMVADFGPAADDVFRAIKQQYSKSTGKPLPKGYNDEE